MPTYVYEPVDGKKCCDACCEGFEVEQSMKEKPLASCPHCGSAVKRVITSVNISTSPSTKSLLGDKNLKKHGFTKLVNEGEGKFRKI